MRTLAHATLVFAYSFFPHALPAATWSALNAGLPASSVNVASIIISPAQPSTLYARTIGSDGISGGVFKSTDGAATWSVLSSPVVGADNLAVDPQDPATLYAVVHSRILRSRDGGNTWTAAGAGLPATTIITMVVDSASNLYVVVVGARVFRSADGATTWQALDLGLSSNSFVSSLVVDPADPSRLYALANFSQNDSPPQTSILRSTDSGQTWNPVPNGRLSGAVTSLVISATAPSLLFAIAPSGPYGTPIFRSSDGGDTWAPLNSGLPTGAYVSSLAIDPSNSSRIYLTVNFYVSGVGDILQSDDSGDTWTPIQPDLPANAPVGSLAIDPSSPSTLYGLSNNVILKSTDGGYTWCGAAAGLSAIDVFALAVSPLDPSTVYASNGNTLFKSLDAGTTWNLLSAFQLFNPKGPVIVASPYHDGSPTYPRNLLIDFSDPDNLYLSTNRSNGCYAADNLLFKSTDGGASWDDSISPQTSGCVLGGLFAPAGGLKAMDPTDPATLYVAEDDDEDGYWQLLRSRDGGATWNSVGDFPNGFPNNVQAGVWALAIDPTMPATMYAAMDDLGIYSHLAGGVYKTTDGGITWNSIGLSGAAVNLLVIAPGASNVLYAATEGDYGVPHGFRGLFKSTDSGATWSAVNTGLDDLIATGSNADAIAIDPIDTNRLYLGVSGSGVFKSADGGATWMPFNAGLVNLNVRSLAFAPGCGHTLYAGTGGGVFKIVDDGGATQ